ncbi:unnamed protein product, partial [Polarella glacialis]
PNEQSDASYVYASRVNDGVCDCCDGSDEWRAGQSLPAGQQRLWPHPVCPNTCAQEGKDLRRERDQLQADLRSGIRQRQALIEAARSEKLQSNDELQKLRADMPILEDRVVEAKDAVEAARRALEERQILDLATQMAESHDFDQDAEAAAEEPAPAAVAEESSNADSGFPGGAPVVPADMEAAFAASVARSTSAAPDAEGEAPLVADAPKAEGAVISEYTKWMDGAEKVLDSVAEASNPDAAETDGSPADAPATATTEQRDESEDIGFFGQLRALWEKARSWVFGRGASPDERAVDSAEEALKAVEKKVKAGRQRQEELERKVATAEDEEQLAYSGLEGRCISKKQAEYKYEACFFKKAKQDHTSIGTWKGWEAPGVAVFDGGQYCPGGPDRSFKVRFRCGPTEELLEITEPSRCAYEAELRHPAACTEVLLKALEERGPRHPRDEL